MKDRIVMSIKQTCGLCPSQWEFVTASHKVGLVHYRRGVLSVDLAGAVLLSFKLAGDYDGDLSTRQMFAVLSLLEFDTSIAKLT